MKAPKRKTFEELLFGVYNIAPEPTVEPGDARGRAVNQGALDAAKALYDMMEVSIARKTGVLLVVRLLAETTCAKDPETYAEIEAKRGFDGDRQEEKGATIMLPSGI